MNFSLLISCYDSFWEEFNCNQIKNLVIHLNGVPKIYFIKFFWIKLKSVLLFVIFILNKNLKTITDDVFKN